MPSFANPFQGNSDRKMRKEELIQALRLDMASELEAMYLYEAHAMATDDEIIKKVLLDIRDEEREHAGELLSLIRYLDPEIDSFLTEGAGEVREMMEELKIPKEVIEKSTGPLRKDK